MPSVGDIAPDFTATDCHGAPLRLSSLRGRRVVLFIGPDGRIEDIIRHEVRVYRHLDDVLRYLRAHPLPSAPAPLSAAHSHAQWYSQWGAPRARHMGWLMCTARPPHSSMARSCQPMMVRQSGAVTFSAPKVRSTAEPGPVCS